MLSPGLRPVIPTCPACGRALALGDRNGRHVASEVHYPRLDASGAMVCSPPGKEVHLGAAGERVAPSLLGQGG